MFMYVCMYVCIFSMCEKYSTHLYYTYITKEVQTKLIDSLFRLAVEMAVRMYVRTEWACCN